MNILTQIATEFFINKPTLLRCLRTLNLSEEVLHEFQQDRIYIDEEFIRRKIRLITDATEDKSFQDLCCHEDGVQFVFYVHLYDLRFIRFRLSFDVKIIALILNTEQQTRRELLL